MILTTNRLSLLPTAISDLDFVVATEQAPENARYIGQWSKARHKAAIASSEEAHYIVTIVTRSATEFPQRLGYVILTGITNPDLSLGIKRIVITQKGKGYGRQALRLAKALAFEQYGCHRLWLDVVLKNSRAKALYESEDFVLEGIIRDGYKTATGYESMALMSLLAPEYFAQQAAQ
ncbi:MAG: Acetyltransferase [Phormidesmis priestleyi Ana]|uniref:Acetyltransferase n=1 Tax=Phormidesmis priestleyi Ana TaxID=1666911 RepID=A0A0P7Z2X7_9CYAN|nr:MAG: Acetyltransferase [Phormidesmis priestleyi Ana]